MSLNAATLEEPALRAGLAERRARSVAAAACLLGLAALAGTGAALQPLVTLAPFAALALVALAFLAPVTHLMMLLLTTSVVGYAIQHQFGSHLLPSDAFLLTGLLRAAVTLLRQRLEVRRLAVVALMSAFAAATVLQVVHGLATGANSSEAGAEGRVLLGFCSVLIAIPILNDADG